MEPAFARYLFGAGIAIAAGGASSTWRAVVGAALIVYGARRGWRDD